MSSSVQWTRLRRVRLYVVSRFVSLSPAISPFARDAGGKVVYLGINGSAKTRIAIETPAMVMPFGVTPYQEATGGDIQSYSVDVSFRTADVDPKVAEFQKRIEAFDELLVNVATENSLEWFGKKVRHTRRFRLPFHFIHRRMCRADAQGARLGVLPEDCEQ